MSNHEISYASFDDHSSIDNNHSIVELNTDGENGNPIKPNFDATNGLRGLCSLMIAVGHFFDFYTPNFQDEQPVQDGKVIHVAYLIPVSMFFILSGMLYGYLYYDKWEGDYSCCCCPASDNFKRFMCKRYIRLAPMVVVGAFLDFGYFIMDRPALPLKLVSVPATTLLFHSATLFVGVNGPSWQVSSMFLSYMLLPKLINQFKIMDASALNGQFRLYSCLGIAPVLVVFLVPDLFIIVHVLWYFRVSQFIAGIVYGVYMKKNQVHAASTMLVDICTGIWMLYFIASVWIPNLDLFFEFLLTPLLAVYLYHMCFIPDGQGITNRIFRSSVF